MNIGRDARSQRGDRGVSAVVSTGPDWDFAEWDISEWDDLPDVDFDALDWAVPGAQAEPADSSVAVGLFDLEEVWSARDCAGGRAAGLLHQIETTCLEELSEFRLVDLVRAQQRLVNHLMAAQALTVRHLWMRRTEDETVDLQDMHDEDESLHAEMQAELAWGRRKATRLLQTAGLLGEWPAVATACLSGRLETSKAMILLEGACLLSHQSQQARVVARLLPTAHMRTHRQLRKDVAREVYALDSEAATKREKHKISQRDLELIPDEVDGVADLRLIGVPADAAVEIYNRADAMARVLEHGGDTRTLAQLRHDVVCAQLLGKEFLPEASTDNGDGPEPGQVDPEWDGAEPVAATAEATEASTGDPAPDAEPAPDACPACQGTGTDTGAAFFAGFTPPVKARIQLTANLFDVLGLIDLLAKHNLTRPDGESFGDTALPAELGAYGPLSTELARRIAANNLDNPDARYDIAVTHPSTGRLLQLHPLAARTAQGLLRQLLDALWQECTFPSCQHPASKNEADHNHEHARGGRTELANLHSACGPHHGIKTSGKWRAEQPEPGHVIWTSPTGRTYHSQPPPLTRPTRPDPSRVGPFW